MQLNKNIKVFINYFLGPLLFLWLSFSIYKIISEQENLKTTWHTIIQSFHTTEIFYLIATIILMILNWSVEAIKWKTSVKEVQPLSFFTAFKAVLSGTSFSLGTPNRVGEYLGRIIYMSEGKRLKTISLTIVGSMSQLIVTLFMGLVGLFFIKQKIISNNLIEDIWLNAVQYGTILVFSGVLIFYFRLPWLVKIVDKIPSFSKFNYLINTLELYDATLLLKLLSLSFVRFLIFSLQYYLVFQFFGVHVGVGTVFCVISVMLLTLSIIPSITLAEFGLRGEISLKLMGLYSINSLGIGLAVGSVWFINLIIPAIFGSIFIIGVKFLKK